MNNFSEFAFPCIEYNDDGSIYMNHSGMSFRQYAAVAAMQGLICAKADLYIEEYAQRAMEYADALIKELSK